MFILTIQISTFNIRSRSCIASVCRPVWVSAVKLRIKISFHIMVQFGTCLIQCGGFWCLKRGYRLYTLAWWRPFQNIQLATFANLCMAFYLALTHTTSYNPPVAHFANIAVPRQGCRRHSRTNEMHGLSTWRTLKTCVKFGTVNL